MPGPVGVNIIFWLVIMVYALQITGKIDIFTGIIIIIISVCNAGKENPTSLFRDSGVFIMSLKSRIGWLINRSNWWLYFR